MTSPAPRFLPLFAAIFAVAPACTPAPENDELDFRTTCGATCPLNSPEIDDAPFPELELSGLPNSDGVSLIGLRDPAFPQDIHPLVINDRDELVVLDENQEILYHADDLVGWHLVLEKDSEQVWGTIVAYRGDEPPWNLDGRPFITYAIAFTDDNLTKNVCPTYYEYPTNPVLTLIRGETYDRDLKIVHEIDADWVTFACADQAAFKAKALGYEQNVDFAQTGAPATETQQNATLKMITADYCGTGLSFTEQGTKIYWENAAGTVVPDVDVNDPGLVEGIEAVWNDQGAICLDTPRFVLRAEVEAECLNPPPECDEVDWANMGYEWITYKPA